MAKSISARFGFTRWSAGPDTWSRTELDANFGQLEALGLVVRADVAANRGTPARNLELFVASDTGLVSFGRVLGGAWVDFGRLGSANTWAALGAFTAGLSVAGGLTVDSVTASKSIYGALGTLSFSNEAARDAYYTGIGGVVGIQICYLSAPTGGGSAGLYVNNGIRWLPLRNYGMQIAMGSADWPIAEAVAAGQNNQGIITTWGAAPNTSSDRTAVDNWDTTGGTFNRATGIWAVGITGRYRLAAFANCSVPGANNVAHSLSLAFAHRKAAGGGAGAGGWESNGIGAKATTHVPAAIAYNQFATVTLPEFDVTLTAGDSVALTIVQLAGTYPGQDKALGAVAPSDGATYFRAELLSL